MARIIDDVSEFRADRPWGARDLAEIDGATVRLHWSDQPYVWHVNDGPEVFIVLSGQVDMYFKLNGGEKSVRLGPSDVLRQCRRPAQLLCTAASGGVRRPIVSGRRPPR
jgi:mannose-6-phosphate isomerase-like protein (cupin superfamily)